MALTVPRYTVDELAHFPGDGNRYELLDGILLVTPAPSRPHQIVSTRLIVQLSAGLGAPAPGHVVGPGAIVRAPGTQLEPDVLVTPARFSPSVEWSKVTEHWLAVEVLSPSSVIYDRDFKRAAYFALGVREVWLVDVDDRSVDAWTSPATHDVVRDVIRWRVPVGDRVVTIDVPELFAGMA